MIIHDGEDRYKMRNPWYELKDDNLTSIWIDTSKIIAIIIPNEFAIKQTPGAIPGIANIHCGLQMPIVVRNEEATKLLKFVRGMESSFSLEGASNAN